MKRYMIAIICFLLVVLNGCAGKEDKKPESTQVEIPDQSEGQEQEIISDYEEEAVVEIEAPSLETNYEEWGKLPEEEIGKYYSLCSMGLFYERRHPHMYLAEADIKAYTEKLFLNLCRYPERIEYCSYPDDSNGYYDDFSKLYWESEEKFRQIDFLYDDTEWRYDWAETEWKEIIPEKQISAITTVSARYTWSGEPVVERWNILFSWDFMIEDGLIRLQDIRILPSKENILQDINQAITNMNEKELDVYTEKLFFVVTQYPQFFHDCSQVFTAGSQSLWQDIVWYYENPDKFYDWSESYGIWEGDIFIGTTVVDSRYAYWEMDMSQYLADENASQIANYEDWIKLYNAQEVKWKVCYKWNYNKNTGKIEITDYSISPSTDQ